MPPGFWDRAVAVNPEAGPLEDGEPVTLRLDPEVLRWFRSLGTDYRSRMNAVLTDCVQARRKAG